MLLFPNKATILTDIDLQGLAQYKVKSEKCFKVLLSNA
jgi:hypothetical protein